MLLLLAVSFLFVQSKSSSTKLSKTKIKENSTVKIEAVIEKGSDIKKIKGMVYVKGGTFQMGSNDEYVDDNEKSIHTITVKDFYIGKYEVTQKEWKAVMGNNPSGFKGDNLPVESVSWNDVQKFIKKLNRQTGKHYRLPTEAEWEYAARGGIHSNGYKYSGSDNMNYVAWYGSNSGHKTHAVGTMQPNELGIYDMSGNVKEWCNDRYQYNYYSNSPSNNPKGPSTGSLRVLRGGSWFIYCNLCRSSSRDRNNPFYSDIFIGFRLVRDK